MTITDFTAYHREYYYTRREKMIAYLGGKCARCVTDESLEFDHIEPELKSFDISANLTISNPAVRDELDKCQLLCTSCHRAKTAAENSGWRHGTVYGWMKKKCFCDECDHARQSFYSERKKKRRAATEGAILRGEDPRQVVKGEYGRPSKCGEKLHYTRGCRCADCRAANAASERERKARKSEAA